MQTPGAEGAGHGGRGTPSATREAQCVAAARVLAACGGDPAAAAVRLGIGVKAVVRRAGEARRRGLVVEVAGRVHNPPAVVVELLQKYLHVAERLAARIHQTLPEHVPLDDVEQAARIGLWEAVQRFDAARGLQFLTYAVPLMRGRIFDELRQLDPLSRGVRQLERRRKAVEDELGPRATREEIQARLGWDDETYAASRPAVSLSLSRQLHDADDRGREETLADVIADPRPPPEIDLAGHVADVLRGLNLQERSVVFLYHWRSLTMSEVGTLIGVSESRVSQVHEQARARLAALGRDELLERAASARA